MVFFLKDTVSLLMPINSQDYIRGQTLKGIISTSSGPIRLQARNIWRSYIQLFRAQKKLSVQVTTLNTSRRAGAGDRAEVIELWRFDHSVKRLGLTVATGAIWCVLYGVVQGPNVSASKMKTRRSEDERVCQGKWEAMYHLAQCMIK